MNFLKLFGCKAGLPQDGTYDTTAQVTWVYWDRRMQVATLKLEVAARLANFIEAQTL
jgi:hypothetical protein